MPKLLTIHQKLQLLSDIHEIQNLMSRYEYLHVANMHQETTELFAQRSPGVKLENGARGIYLGIEGVRRFYGDLSKGMGDNIGHLHLHTSTTPVIEVAGDGETAQGVWVSPGVETSPAKDGGQPSAMWAWIKYGVDFIKEGGEWRIWHLHMYRLFITSYDKSWAEGEPAPAKQAADADRANSYDWVYRRTARAENVPLPPVPYERWDESRSYVK
jgi:hypothetical protein